MSDKHTIIYFVDTEELSTTTSTLSVEQVLQAAGLDPTTHYLVELEGNHQIKHTDLSQVLHLHERERFISVSTAPTPVS